MAVKRRIRKGLATQVLCFLNHEGTADSQLLSRQFNVAEGTMQRVLDKLEDKKLAKQGIMGRRRQDYFVTTNGFITANHTRCKPFLPFKITRFYNP